MAKIDAENRRFIQAASFVNHTNQSLFLTGKAGTGKTTFLKYIREHSSKKLAVVAPTGVAAINAGGTTIHSFFQLPFGTFIPNEESIWGGELQQTYNKNQLLRNQRLRQPQRKLIQSLELLIIDEVSMLRADVLDAMDTLLRSVRRRNHEPFGGLQMLFIGDMFQLPPVIRQNEMQIMSAHYRGPFFFDAHALQQFPLLYIELNKIYRQEDQKFIQLLDHVRNNCCTSDDFELLQKQYQPDFNDGLKNKGYITLTTHNHKADKINALELDRLPGNSIEIKAKIEKDFPENAYPAEEKLKLKLGAQIMFIKNDKGENRRYYNGKIGKITLLDPIKQKIEVYCEEDDVTIDLELETWKNIRYEYEVDIDQIKEKELGSFQQYPIRLAWAVTIHKSQGLTFEKAIVDAERSFAPGQVYVALSRLTHIHGLVLLTPISPHNILVDPRIIHFANQELNADELDEILLREQEVYSKDLLMKAYEFGDFSEEFRNHSASYYEKVIPDRPQAFAWSESLLAPIFHLLEVGVKFIHFLQTAFQQHPVNYGLIHEKNLAATQWFLTKINEQILDSIEKQISNQTGKTRVKKYLAELKDLLAITEHKKNAIQQSLLITDALANDINIQEALKKLRPVNSESTESEVKNSTTLEQKPGDSSKMSGQNKVKKGGTQELSLKRFQEGKSIEEIAKERGLATSTIEGHLMSFIPEGKISVDLFVHSQKRVLIEAIIKTNPTATLSVLKEILGEDFSYSEIKATLKYQEPKI